LSSSVEKSLPKLSEKWSAHYSISTLPIGDWIEIKKDNNLSRLVISGNPSESDLSKCWRSIKSEFVKEIGLGKDFENYIKNTRKIYKLRNKLAITGKRSIINLIKIEQKKIDDYLNLEKQEIDEFKNIAILNFSPNNGLNINPKECTVKMYFHYYELEKTINSQTND